MRMSSRTRPPHPTLSPLRGEREKERGWCGQASLLVFLLIAAGVSTGCRNPFDPEADVRINRFLAQGNNFVAQIEQADANNLITNQFVGGVNMQQVRVVVDNLTTVPVTFESYTVTYIQIAKQGDFMPNSPVSLSPCVQPPGSPICSLGKDGTARYHFLAHLGGLNTDPGGLPFPVVTQGTFDLRIITEELLTYIFNAAPSDIQAGGIDCEITLLGTDHNGHDVQASGTLHIEVF